MNVRTEGLPNPEKDSMYIADNESKNGRTRIPLKREQR